MNFHLRALRARLPHASLKTFSVAITSLLLMLAPGLAHASGGENVRLEFQSSDYVYLWASLGFGALALISAFVLYRKLMLTSPGSAKMQEVGEAIRAGAMAYLKKQIKTMVAFVAILMVGLGALYQQQFGLTVGIAIAFCFAGGVAASYMAGFFGMKMAVAANMRTANAALTSYKSSLEIAFRSGAVAGMATVGMGLMGATIIFMIAGAEAMKLLVGFGFGGSLAALFMRVGGGIFTKAADVGADLVGKVEAGIPEDDPRNPATIADNVGDNVGDCAGMAADVFESYEVTLVAAIVLGAATAALFDTQTWMKLILFALMARGVGIVASLVGILSVKGTDNVDADPLKLIRKGFVNSAVVAGILTMVLAFVMMGGMGKPIMTTQLSTMESMNRKTVAEVAALRQKLATERKVELYQISQKDIQDSPEFKTIVKDDTQGFIKDRIVQQALAYDANKLPPLTDLSGFQKLTPDSKSPVWNYAVMATPGPDNTPPKEVYTDLKSFLGGSELIVARLKITSEVPGAPSAAGQPATPPTKQVQNASFLLTDKVLQDSLDQLKKSGNKQVQVEVLDKKPAALYANSDGKLAVGFDSSVAEPQEVREGINLTYFRQSPAAMNQLEKDRQADPTKAMPAAETMELSMATSTPVEWWRFFLAIVFGLLMAFAIEILTDYYVSTHKRPVREVAEVATAGPAPMIIQGFALGSESSVFSVFAIVISLMFPLWIFPPSTYGGYLLSFYGIALVGLGLLSTTGYILAMDTFGPISDNAQGVFEMSGDGHGNEYGSKAVQRLDAAGNTTKALTKGFAIATAVVAAVALFHSYIDGARLATVGLRVEIPEIFLGLMVGGAAPYLFSAFSINAVGRAAFELINEVRRQFRGDPGIMAGTSKPDYGRCVDIVTGAAQRELLGPGILAIALPALVGFGFAIGKPPVMINGHLYNLTGAQALGGFLVGAIVSGQLLAVLLANSGGIWDNAKKLIEDGMHGGKGTEAHKAGIVCDTVGDPFKDTAGPALNPLIKVMNLFALLMAPYVIMPLGTPVQLVIVIISVALLALAFYWSKRGSLSSSLMALQTDAGAATAAIGAGDVTPQAPSSQKRITVEDEE